MNKKLLLILFFVASFAINIDQVKVKQQIRQALSVKLSNKYPDATIEIFNHPKVSLPESGYKIEVKLPKKLVGLVSVPVVIVGDSNTYKLKYSVKIRVFEEVYALTQSLNKGAALSQLYIQKDRRDVTGLIQFNRKTFADRVGLGNLRAKYFLKKGDILTNRNTESIPDINKGAQLALNISEGNFAVKMQVSAIEEGFIGDVIKVSNSKYKRVLLAEIVSDKEVVLLN